MFRWGPHFGEEPPFAGSRGSGTLFFSHCTLKCIYCQNAKWSNGGRGEDLTIEQLRERFATLIEKGCHNWNLVSPTPWLPQIDAAVRPLLDEGKRLPFVYNTSSYERPETLEHYKHLIDIGLADLRYASALSAYEGSHARDYVEAARASIQWMWHTLGSLECDEDGIAQRGLIVRLLALPGRVNELAENLIWLRNTLGKGVAVSVMAQYNPVGIASVTPGWNRRITEEEFEPIIDLVSDLDFENGWIQPCEDETAECMLGDDMEAGYGEVR
jgi:putative pyruvate formate lyase activating enzyme